MTISKVKMETYEIFELLKEELGADDLLDAVYQFFGGWSMEDCLRDIASDYDIELEPEEEEEEEAVNRSIKVFKLVLEDGEYRDYTGEKEFYNAGDLLLVYKSDDDLDYSDIYDEEYILNNYESTQYRIYVDGELYQEENQNEWLDEEEDD